jgi:hypothetical protein
LCVYVLHCFYGMFFFYSFNFFPTGNRVGRVSQGVHHQTSQSPTTTVWGTLTNDGRKKQGGGAFSLRFFSVPSERLVVARSLAPGNLFVSTRGDTVLDPLVYCRRYIPSFLPIHVTQFCFSKRSLLHGTRER